MSWMDTLRKQARVLKQHSLTLYYAARDPRTPLWIKVLALLVAAYAFSPIDFIPDFIPVLGFLDDVILLPLGIYVVMRYLPEQIKHDAQTRAAQSLERPTSKMAAAAIVLIWLLALWWAGQLAYRLIST